MQSINVQGCYPAQIFFFFTAATCNLPTVVLCPSIGPTLTLPLLSCECTCNYQFSVLWSPAYMCAHPSLYVSSYLLCMLSSLSLPLLVRWLLNCVLTSLYVFDFMWAYLCHPASQFFGSCLLHGVLVFLFSRSCACLLPCVSPSICVPPSVLATLCACRPL